MTSQHRRFLTSLALAVGLALCALPPVGSAARAQALQWATQAGGESSDAGSDIATTERGDSYVTGSFEDTATFGQGEPNQTILTAAGDADLFVAKYDSDGALVWAIHAGGTGSGVGGSGIATTELGDSYVTGSFYGTITFGQGEPNETTLTAAGLFWDIFVARYDPDGALLWATRAGSADSSDVGGGVSIIRGGDGYVTGYFQGTATFGQGEPNETTLTSASNDIFVAKYDPDGALAWATQTVGDGSGASGRGIATTNRGDSYVTGGFGGTVIFGQGEPNETTLTSAQGNIFVAKYDRDGALLWATQAGGGAAPGEGGTDIATNDLGDSYVTGHISDSATFGRGEPNETTLTSAQGNIFVAKYDRDGALLWATQPVGGSRHCFGYGIATTEHGDSYVTGVFDHTETFGQGEPNETTLSTLTENGYTESMFLAKYDRDGALLWATQAAQNDSPGLAVSTTRRGDGYVTGDFRGTAIFGQGEPNETTLTSAGGQDIFVAKYR
jgi:predicted regulator of Ras-like GTPase activity (Roadblock/LC7/MglB family)